ncbi:acyltransferase [Vibrio sp. S/42/10]|uniref:acyltransferase n=1 Tax=Vibrio sp. S/42/10 TaxID=2914757 RepID=UPI00246822E7|nr:acyltransferase [Vibrio sp. S/42/10]MDH5881563.1 acyltransferase [Vibrio sp. S/42/10]
MAYLTRKEIDDVGFKYVGCDVKISSLAIFYEPEKIIIGDYSRIDDLCIISGNVDIGCFCHITPFCLIAGGTEGVTLSSYVTLAYGVKVFSQSDDYTGSTMTNSIIPKKYKNEYCAKVEIREHSIIGTNSIIMPGVVIEIGCSIGANSLVNKSTSSWGIYFGSPAKRVKNRKKELLNLVTKFESGLNNGT